METTEALLQQTTLMLQESDPIWCSYYQLTFAAIFPLLLTSVGLVCNVLTVLVLWPDRNHSATMFLLICLSLSDTVFVIWFTVIKVPTTIWIFHNQPKLAQSYKAEYLAYTSFCGEVSRQLSIWFTIFVTWQWYLGACRPFLYAKYGSLKAARILVVASVLIITVFNLPKIFELYTVKTSAGMTFLQRRPFSENKYYVIIVKLAIYYSFCYVITIAMLLFMTCALIGTSRNMRKKKSALSKQATKEEFTLSIVIVVIISLVGSLSLPIRRTLVTIYPLPKETMCDGVFFYYEITSLITITSCSCNFIIYVLMFRIKVRNFMAKCSSCCRGNSIGPTIEESPKPTNSILQGRQNDPRQWPIVLKQPELWLPRNGPHGVISSVKSY